MVSPDTPCRNNFERWAKEDPERLVRVLTDGSLPDTLLTFAAEIAGKALPSDVVLPALVELLHHASPVVREGALLGIEHHMKAVTMREYARLLAMAANDPSPGVRETAQALVGGEW